MTAKVISFIALLVAVAGVEPLERGVVVVDKARLPPSESIARKALTESARTSLADSHISHFSTPDALLAFPHTCRSFPLPPQKIS